MASGTGGIDLLSMYNDEEEDEDELMEETPATVLEPAPEPVDEVVDDGRRFDDAEGRAKDTPPGPAFESTSTPPFDSRSTPHSEEGDYDETLKIPVARSPTPPPFPRMQRSSPFTLVSTPPQGPSSAPIESWDPPGTRRGALSIVDYGHDDTAMSPEPEEEEIFGNGRVTVSAEVQASEVKLEERTPPGTVQVSTTNVQQSFQQTELSELPSETPMDFTGNEIEVSHFEETVVASAEVHKDDILTNFLRPPLSVKCSEELQEKINKFLAYKRAGKSFNADLRNRKDYRNPDFLQHAVRYQEIDEIGSCFSKDVFDPHGYDKSDYYDEIENEMRREIERKDMERKKSQRMEFVSGGTAIIQTSKLSTQNPVASISVAVNTSLSLVSTAGDALGKDARQNKKTKWDKVDSDVKNTIAGGQDNAPTTGLHAAILSASNAGAGYTAFAQQKRKEAEVKRTSDKRLDKRS